MGSGNSLPVYFPFNLLLTCSIVHSSYLGWLQTKAIHLPPNPTPVMARFIPILGVILVMQFPPTPGRLHYFNKEVAHVSYLACQTIQLVQVVGPMQMQVHKELIPSKWALLSHSRSKGDTAILQPIALPPLNILSNCLLFLSSVTGSIFNKYPGLTVRAPGHRQILRKRKGISHGSVKIYWGP